MLADPAPEAVPLVVLDRVRQAVVSHRGAEAVSLGYQGWLVPSGKDTSVSALRTARSRHSGQRTGVHPEMGLRLRPGRAGGGFLLVIALSP